MADTTPRPATDEAFEPAVTAARAAYEEAHAAGLESDIASCASWFGWHAALKAAAPLMPTERGMANGWSAREWQDWSNELAAYVPDDGEVGNPEGTQEGLILDYLKHLVAENQRLADRWTELRERAEKGRDTVDALRLAETDDDFTRRRLAGKLDGIKTVLSYMDDAEGSGR